jgi:Fic family protein
MNNGGYGFKGLIPIEEVIDNNRADYYSALEPNSDVTLFVEFFLQSFVDSAKMTLEKASSIKEEKPEDILPLRRQEIVRIIKDHPYASANLIFRRFPKVNQKTLLYDLGQLLKSGFVVKVGKTRGVTYLIKDKKLETHGG